MKEYLNVVDIEDSNIKIPKDKCGRTFLKRTTEKGTEIHEVFINEEQKIKKYGDDYVIVLPKSLIEEHRLQDEQLVWFTSVSFISKHCEKKNQNR